MARHFTKRGRLKIPIFGGVQVPEGTLKKQGEDLIVREAYCSKGHDLMSDVRIDGEKGIRFLYASPDGSKEAEIVISPFLRKCKKKILSGEPFAKDEPVRILCPFCRIELPVLYDCECGAPIYLFYIDRSLNHHYGQSLCSRIGCVRSSQLRFSGDAMRDFLNEHSF